MGPSTATWRRRSPIGDLYKSQLRAVAGALGVPESIVAKPPSADLWPGQTDEGELGRSYDLLDRALFALVDRRWTVDRCVAAGLDRARRVGRLARRAHGVQAAAAARGEALPAYAGVRPPLPATRARLPAVVPTTFGAAR